MVVVNGLQLNRFINADLWSSNWIGPGIPGMGVRLSPNYRRFSNTSGVGMKKKIDPTTMKNEDIVKLLEDIKSYLDILFKAQTKLNNQIVSLRNDEDKLRCERDNRKIKKFYKSPKRFTEEQWLFILEAGNNISESQYRYSQTVMESLGFSAFGYHQDTNQKILGISEYRKNKKLPANFELFKAYVKPVTVTDRMQGRETGIRITVTGLCEDETSVIYVKKDGGVTLYISRYDEKKQFQSFQHFIHWLDTKYQAKDD